MCAARPPIDGRARDALQRIFDAAVESAAPGPAVTKNLPDKPTGRCIVVGAGKAAAAMAAAVDAAWPDVELSGVVSTRYGHAVPAGRIEVIEAGHPIPDAASASAAVSILDAVSGLTRGDLVIALISGGGSATMALPIEPLSLDEKQSITRQLLTSGATIGEVNTVRTHLSRIKGGKLAAAAAPAQLWTFIISDVPGDDPAGVASGPTVARGATSAEALALLDRYAIDISAPVRQYLLGEADQPDVPTGNLRIVASPAQALSAASDAVRELDMTPVILGDAIESESRELGRTMAGIARSVRGLGEPATAPAVLLSGGETTVTIGSEGAGRGGRNTEFALSLAVALRGADNIWALAADSDGIDGTEDAAGAIVSPDTLERAAAAGFDAGETLRRHDSYSLFDAIGDLVMTGPTLTNVNDIRMVMIA